MKVLDKGFVRLVDVMEKPTVCGRIGVYLLVDDMVYNKD